MNFRDLTAEEISVRVQSVHKAKDGAGTILLLYKDARCDMNILDATVGPMNWKRRHSVVNGNLFCSVLVYDSDKKEWVEKEDVGTESNTEKEKGQASDAFKRACTNWGIGRELYTSPFIWVELATSEYNAENGKYKVRPSVKFNVKTITVEGKKIINLVIVDQDGKVRFEMNKKAVNQPKPKTDRNTDADLPPDEILVPLPSGERKTITQMKRFELLAVSKDKTLSYLHDRVKELLGEAG